MVVLRKREMDNPHGHLFDRFGWSYSLFVTDRDWKPEDVARFYDKRADVERTICEAKNDLSIDHVPTSSFGANAADLAIKVLARNLLVLYRDRGLKLRTCVRIATLRRRFIAVAGRLVRHAGGLVLRLSPSHFVWGKNQGAVGLSPASVIFLSPQKSYWAVGFLACGGRRAAVARAEAIRAINSENREKGKSYGP